MNKLLRGLILLGALGLVFAVMALLGSRSGSRGALQRYKAELRAQGEKLTFAEFPHGRRTNAVDSHAIITNAVAELVGARLNPGMLELRKYVQPGRAIVTWRQANPLWGQPVGAGGGGTWEELAVQMQAAQSTLQEIRDALKEPALDGGPRTNLLTGRRVNFVAIRTAAQWLMGAAENDLHLGRLEAGLRNLEALAALGRMEREACTLVAQMIRVSVVGLGLSATWEALQVSGWTEPQLERLQKAWELLDLVEALETGLVGERAGIEDLFALLRNSRGHQIARLFRNMMPVGPSSLKETFAELGRAYLYFPAYKLTCIDGDELLYLKTMQGGVKTVRLLEAHRPWLEANQQLVKALAGLDRAARFPGEYRYYVSLLAMPNCVRAGERAIHVEMERQLTLAAIALKRFQLRHGKLPQNLEALVPEFLPVRPYDYMSAKTLGYRLKDKGSYALYSVGDDGKDDGGDPAPSPGTPAGLWAGRDAVWPSPAAEPGEPVP